MNTNLQKLLAIAQKPSRRIVGLMSGTSLDGLDVALCRIQGQGSSTQVVVEFFETVPYAEATKHEIRKVFAKQQIDFQHLVLLNEWIGTLHGSCVADCLERWGIDAAEVDIVASHGQTVFHAPKILHGLAEWPNATLQIGDGDHVAAASGIVTLSDFRQKHIAAGGEGAPLAVYGDFFVFTQAGQNRLMLNMGGIANFTYLPASARAEEVFVTDTGPGNTLLDAFTRRFFPEMAFDQDAALAKQGSVNQQLLEALKADDFFVKPFPKTTGPELFGVDYVERAQRLTQTEGLSAYDLLATLTRFSAETIAEAIQQSMQAGQVYQVYVSGGGAHNPLLMQWLGELLPQCTFEPSDVLGIGGDAKEAVLFAILANEALVGGHTQFGSREGVPSVSMGKISFPN